MTEDPPADQGPRRRSSSIVPEPRVPARGDVDPPPPPPELLSRLGATMLDPVSAAPDAFGRPVRSTAYVRDALLVPLSQLAQVREALGALGVRVDGPAGQVLELAQRLARASDGSIDMPVGVRLSADDGSASVDAWPTLQSLRRRLGLEPSDRLGLCHVLTGNPPRAIPLTTGVAGPTGTQLTGYSLNGNVKLPVAATLRAPARTQPARGGRRPVVAVLDTGCGDHPWFPATEDPLTSELVRRTAGWSPPIGFDDPATDPERRPDQFGPLDGVLDWASGHGTFICGAVHQGGPDAVLLVIRVMQADGSADQEQLVLALHQLYEQVLAHRRDPDSGTPVDVLSLSLGYYPETWSAAAGDPEQVAEPLAEVLTALARSGTAVVVAAGNDATARPMVPAALSASVPALVAVGALNPNGTVAAFSNAGDWVQAYAPGALMVSTLPAVQGSAQPPVVSTDPSGRTRADIDADDYASGFGLWSGTSFAAPWLAGLVAQSQYQTGQGGPGEQLAAADPGQAADLSDRAVQVARRRLVEDAAALTRRATG